MKYTEEERLKFARSHKEQFIMPEIHETAEIHETVWFNKNGFGWVRQEGLL